MACSFGEMALSIKANIMVLFPAREDINSQMVIITKGIGRPINSMVKASNRRNLKTVKLWVRGRMVKSTE